MAAIFQKDLFDFLEDLQANNSREWFQENKQRYEESVREPSLRLIEELAPRMKQIAPAFPAVAKKAGGSLMRIHRDIRFSKSKEPYKTNVGIQLRHEMGRDAHAPGYYIHLAPDECFLGVGCWRPNGESLNKIRASIDANTARWWRAKSAKDFNAQYQLAGDSLKTTPRGYPADHPLIDDLRRKDFIAVTPLSRREVLSAKLTDEITNRFKVARQFMRFLCDALEVPY